MRNFFTLILFVSFIFLFSGCEREGIVNIDDCREVINIEEKSLKSFYKTFTCVYNKTEKDNIINGTCINVDLNLMGDKCKKAYIYEKKPTKKCGENEHLDKDDNCYCNYNFNYNEETKKCEKNKPSLDEIFKK